MTRPSAAIRPGIATRAFYAIPVIGWIGRDISRGIDNVWYALVILLTVIVLAVWAWGLAALAMAALIAVPVVFAILIAITMG